MNAPDRVLIDGVAEHLVPVLDRGLHYGDGVFETLGVRDGALRFEALHRQRLQEGCRRLALAVDVDAAFAELRELARDQQRCLLKLLVTRGDAVARGYAPTGSERPRRVSLRYDWPAERGNPALDGVRVATARTRLGESAQLAGIKHLCRLEQVLARLEIANSGEDEALMANGARRLISGTMSNVFLVTHFEILTPRVDRCGVSGVMREVLIREAGKAGLKLRETDVELAELTRASEIFLTNVRIGVWPVREVDGRRLQPGPVTRRLQGLLEGVDA
jgi:4-amino-4-deoxychorismate lyase